jgi:hypothetical protein
MTCHGTYRCVVTGGTSTETVNIFPRPEYCIAFVVGQLAPDQNAITAFLLRCDGKVIENTVVVGTWSLAANGDYDIALSYGGSTGSVVCTFLSDPGTASLDGG